MLCDSRARFTVLTYVCTYVLAHTVWGGELPEPEFSYHLPVTYGKIATGFKRPTRPYLVPQEPFFGEIILHRLLLGQSSIYR